MILGILPDKVRFSSFLANPSDELVSRQQSPYEAPYPQIHVTKKLYVDEIEIMRQP
jgi:hypothetical protein